MIRPLLPIDLAGLVLFNGRGLRNRVVTRDRIGLGERALPLGIFRRQWLSLRERRQTLVCSHRGVIKGLVSARSRRGPGTWEIDHLLLDEDDGEICLQLLERLSAVAGSSGAGRIFLRLSQASPLLEAARGAGFSPYLNEYLYHFRGPSAKGFAPESLSTVLRPKSPSDDYVLFQLYNAAVPGPVRYAEGLTFSEWQEARELFKTELVCEEGNGLLAWVGLRVEGGWGHFDIKVHPSAEDRLGEIIASSLALLEGKPTILSLVPEFQWRLRRLLGGIGFEQVAGFSILVKQLRARVPEPELTPMPSTGLGPALPCGGRYAQRDYP